MDPRDYHDARWHALVREAVDLGVPEDDAPALVRRVLAEQARHIRRADDPDPRVRAAIQEAVLPAPQPSRGRWWGVVGLAAVLAVVGVVISTTRPDPPLPDRLREDQVPSLFGYDGPHAAAYLEDRGLRVSLQPSLSCEVYGRVVGSDPGPGTPYDDGDRVTVFTSRPEDVTCLTDYQQRATAWELLDFANGRGAPPRFAREVSVYDGAGSPPTVLTRQQARERDAWSDTRLLDVLRAASQRVELTSEHPLTYAVSALDVTTDGADAGRCGVPQVRPDAGSREAFRFVVLAPDRSGCPVQVEVHEHADEISALVLYSGAS